MLVAGSGSVTHMRDSNDANGNVHMSNSSMLHVRIDDETKARASEALESMGLSVSDAVRILLRRVVADQAFPLELKVPNSETRAAMHEADRMIEQRRVRFSDERAMTERLDRVPDPDV